VGKEVAVIPNAAGEATASPSPARALTIHRPTRLWGYMSLSFRDELVRNQLVLTWMKGETTELKM